MNKLKILRYVIGWIILIVSFITFINNGNFRYSEAMMVSSFMTMLAAIIFLVIQWWEGRKRSDK